MEKLLEHSIAENRLAGAYLLVGSRGAVAKEADSFILRIMCDRGSACGVCPGCKKVLAGTHPDVFRVFRQKGRAHIVVEDISFITGEASQISFEGGSKVFFIAEADLMVEQAQNKLLKIIEEPPENTVFMLGVDNVKNILPTILSRCTVIKVSGSDIDIVAEKLRNEQGTGMAEADMIARTSGGDYYTALDLIDSGYTEIRNSMAEVARRLLTQKNRATSIMMSKLMAYDKQVSDALMALEFILTDCLEIKNGLQCKPVNSDMEQQIREWASMTSASRIAIALDEVLEAESRKKQSSGVSAKLLYEGMLLKILEKTV